MTVTVTVIRQDMRAWVQQAEQRFDVRVSVLEPGATIEL